ncbi:capsular polysaccharide synthesis protein [Actinoplanes sp. NEAU-A12]|uniref:Capsular polysaccharide synthesis protein n=1 Tax=Actinoplanes sandaracinus TaxID=3045177 RepID=A0ABT6WDN1_9ACTN|nr:capsular polysaccharide synthesis protein [Actinoplanes sandaracinus]MDI6097834.1 capsular polysaccharide synthesis protein [Actinoplanes sandaracinus]
MTATAPTDSWPTRFRAALRRTPQPEPRPAPVVPSVVNLVPDPGFRGAIDRPAESGGVDVPPAVSAEPTEVPGRPGVTGLRVTALSGDNDTWIAPGGIRLGLRAGGTYTASVSVFLTEPLGGPLHPSALRLAPGWTTGEPAPGLAARSMPARNEFGHHRISVTFTIPPDARDACVRLCSGMTAGHGAVIWYDYTLTETAAPVGHFDGSTPDDASYVHQWTGEPNASPSRRTLRPAPAAFHPETPEEAAFLRSLAVDDPMAAARLALAAGDRESAVSELRRVAKAGDPDGEAAYELGRLALAERKWATAEQLLRGAVAKRPEAFERGYALALAYDKLKRRDDSRRASAAALVHDTKLPFDGPALLDSDVTSFGARREIGIFLAEHLTQIRTQAEQRLARPVRSTFDQPIFVYWAQGFEAAPPVVKACLAALKANNPGSRVHELSLDNLGGYVDVPEDLADALADDHFHFSDLLRMLLLEKFGGIWVDATCFVSEPLRPHIDRALAKGGVFAFNYTGPYLVNWFLASRPDSYVMHLWRAASFLWWEKRGEIVDPLLHHHVFEMLHRLDDRFRAEWDAGLRLNATPPHALQSVMLRPYEPEMLQTIMEGAFVHKLRYQVDGMTSESYLARIIRGDHGNGA